MCFKKIGRNLSRIFRENVDTFTFEHNPNGALRYSIKFRNPIENQNIDNNTTKSKLGSSKVDTITAEKQKTERGDGSTSVFYKIASSFPSLNTKAFHFLTDWQAWFLIENRDKKRYKAYITMEFISGGRKEKAGGSYDGTKGWNLNALSGIIAPGLGIPSWIKEKALQEEPIKIRILCEVKDENNELVEKKLPVEYAYNYKSESWYFNPAPEN